MVDESKTVCKALRQATLEAHNHRWSFAEEYIDAEEREFAVACIIATFLENIPIGVDAGTLLAELRCILND